MTSAAPKPVIAVAADAREFQGLLRHASGSRRLQGRIRFLREARIAGRRWILAANGEGPRMATLAVQEALRVTSDAVVVSTGNCGALDPSLRIGDIFVATEVQSGEGVEPMPVQAPEMGGSAMQGPLLSIDRVAVTAREKASLRSNGARAIEMEAAAVAQSATGSGCPFFCIRAVSDTADQDLPLDFNHYRDTDGRLRMGLIAAAALLRPKRLRGLMALARGSRLASQNLGDFLARCPF